MRDMIDIKPLIKHFSDHSTRYRWYRKEIAAEFERLISGAGIIAETILLKIHPAYSIIYRDEIVKLLKEYK